MSGLVNIGDVLASKYRVEKILGIGGMGMVVAATHLELDQKVALKFMLPAAVETTGAAARFMREARAAGKLTSDHVCRVIDVGRFATGTPYIVMEYLEGYDLSSLLKRRGPLPIPEAVDYIIQATEGVAAAHANNIIHRDLKPDNLFLAYRNDGGKIIKVLDFGISKLANAMATKTGDVMGSPAYMAPEQMHGSRDVDARADVWSLGVVLYQLVSGRPPFIADTLPALCLTVLNDPPPSLEEVRADLPPGFADVIVRCLEKEREDRYGDVGELAAALAPYGLPSSDMAVTRIESVLGRRERLSLPPGFSDDPTVPTEMLEPDDIGLPPPTLPPGAVATTFSRSAGQSMELPRQRGGRGYLHAIVGAAVVVAILVVIALKTTERTTSTTSTTELPPPPTPRVVTPAVAPSVPPAAPSTETPHTETPPSDPASDASSDRPAGSAMPSDPASTEPDVGSSPPHKRVRPHSGRTPARPIVPVGSGSAGSVGSAGSAGSASIAPEVTPVTPPPAPPDAAPIEDEDKWSHMTHDKPQGEAP